MESTVRSTIPIVNRRIKWPEILVWIIWAAAYVVLFRKAFMASAENTLWVHVLYTLTFFGAGLVFINSTRQSQDKRRWTWSLLALSNFASGVMALIGLGIRKQILEYSKFGFIQVGFIILAYVLVFVGVAVYLPRRLSLRGNLASVTLDSIIVGLTTLLCLKILLPRVFPWPSTEEASGTQIFIAFDMALLFAFCLVVIRYFRQDSNPLLILLCLATICQTLGDIFYMVFAWIPGSSFAMTDTVVPLYMLRSSLWALGAHWSIQHIPPKQKIEETKRLMPYSEWFAWTRTSRMCLLFVFGALVLSHEVPGWMFGSLLVAAIFREALSTHQEREVLRELQIANDQKQEAIEELGSVNHQLIAAHEQIEKAAVIEERHRLARELHDSTCQMLSGQVLMAEAGLRMIRQGDLERSAEHLTRVRDVAHEVHRDMRLLLYELRPPVLGENSLMDVLRQRLEGVERRTGVEVSLIVEGDKLPAPVEEAFYRVAWEALNNASKHAAATSVKVSIHVEGEQAELEVTDNGKGFDLEAASQQGGLGLMTMRERVENLGGTFVINSSPGNGTQVKASLALDANVSLAG